jgi:3-oxoacyl-[acyl-carrier protein] reductase
VRVDLDGTYFVLRAFWELLRRSPRRAKVICFSGGGATKARANFSAYASAKTGVVRLVETLAVEWAGLPMDINAIAPGAINTAMTRETVSRGPELSGRAEYEAAQRQLAEGGQSIEKVCALVEFLLSEKSDGITGRLLSAQWDDWAALPAHATRLAESEIYQLRRILPEERGAKF